MSYERFPSSVLTHFAAALMAAIVVAPAAAQSDRQRDDRAPQARQQRDQRDGDQRDRERRDLDQRDREQFERSQSRQDRQSGQDQRDRDQTARSSARQGRWLVQPQGWVTIAVDTDGDRRLDSTETIYYYDLQRARRSSAERRDAQRDRDRDEAQRDRDQAQRDRDRAQRDRDQARQERGEQRYRSDRPRSERSGASGQQPMMSAKHRRQNETRTITGTISSLKTFRLADGPRRQLAKLTTAEGQNVPVDLGRVEELQRLDLQSGDEITVTGQRSRVDDRKMFTARRIESGDTTITLGREQDRGLKRVQGEITNLKTTRFRRSDQEFQVARVDLKGGRSEQVILGPVQKLNELDLQPGDEVQMLVRRGRYNDQPALIADQIRAAGEVVRVTKPERRQLRTEESRRNN